MSKFKIEWKDSGREPQSPPNPKYPQGIFLDARDHNGPACMVDLPYPAKRCGVYLVECTLCGMRVAVTTAGRPDDPTGVGFNCKES